MNWPELHILFKVDTDSDLGNSTSEVRRQNVINNPHIVDWFFTQRLESFVKHWLYDMLGAKWHWFIMNTKVEVVSIVMVLLN